MKRGLTPIACCLALLAWPAAAAATTVDRPVGAPQATDPAISVADRVIVRFDESSRPAQRLASRSDAGVALGRTLGRREVQLVEPRPGVTVAAALAELRADPAVVSAARDGFYRPQAAPSETWFGNGTLWGLRNLGISPGVLGFADPLAGADIDALGAWERTAGTPATVVAVIDSGYSFGHPDLDDRHWVNAAEAAGAPGVDDDGNGYVDDVRGYDFVGPDAENATPDPDPTDDDLLDGGHGVHVAGTIGASRDDGGVVGVAPDVRLMPLRVCSYSAEDEGVICPYSAMIEAIGYAAANGARVANVSLGGAQFRQDVVDALAASPDVLFAISAGNGGEDGVGDDVDATPTYPCAYDPSVDRGAGIEDAVDNVVCVAATDQADGLTGFSNFGVESVDLAAPGAAILSAYPVALRFGDDFETANFSSRWTAVGADGGFARSSESPLTSWGMSDSPGAPPTAGSQRASETTAGVALPAGAGACVLSGRRRVALGGGLFRYTIVRDGTDFASFEPGNTAGGGMASFSTQPVEGLGGGAVKLRFSYTAGASPTAAHGVWIDDLRLQCYEPVGSTAATYAYLNGTSMAAPHVAGAAALLFSFSPESTVTEVRDALLASVDPVAALDGKLATGGRLDASRALDLFDDSPGGGDPGDPGEDPGDPGGGDPGDPSGPGDPGGGSGPGGGQPPIAISPPTGNPPLATGPTRRKRCRVPHLRGLTVGQARRKLARFDCRLGKLRRTKAARGKRLRALVVASARPRAGSRRANGTRIALTLRPRM